MNDYDELLARADAWLTRPATLGLPVSLVRDLRAALATRTEPAAIDMVTDLHRAVYGDTWARPESPQQVWEMLLGQVRGLASGWCGECERRAARAAAGSVTPTDREWVDDVLAMFDEGTATKRAGSATPTGDDT
jgi:hypothetical protein